MVLARFGLNGSSPRALYGRTVGFQTSSHFNLVAALLALTQAQCMNFSYKLSAYYYNPFYQTKILLVKRLCSLPSVGVRQGA